MPQPWIAILPDVLRNKLEGRHDLQNIIANTGWLFADKLLRMCLGLLVGVWLARYLGPQQYGQLNYAVSYVSIFGAIAAMGLNGVVVRNIVREPVSSGAILGSASFIQFCGSIISVSLIVGSIEWLQPHDSFTKLMVVILGSSLFFKPSEVVRYWFESQVQSRYTVIVENVISIIIMCVKVIMILYHASLLAFVWIYFAETALVSLGLLFMYVWRGGCLVEWKPKISYTKHLLKDCWPLVLSSISVIIYLRIDQVMLAEMVGNTSVGVYSAAVTISEIWYFIPVSIVASTLPSIIKAKNTTQELYKIRLQQLYDLMVILALAIAIPMTFLSDYVVNVLFGKNYSDAGAVLAINVWAGVFVFLGTASGVYTNIENLPRYSFFQTSLGMLVNIALNFFMIPLWQAKGAAMATVISYGIAAFSSLFFTKTRSNGLLMINALNVFKKSSLTYLYKS